MKKLSAHQQVCCCNVAFKPSKHYLRHFAGAVLMKGSKLAPCCFRALLLISALSTAWRCKRDKTVHNLGQAIRHGYRTIGQLINSVDGARRARCACQGFLSAPFFPSPTICLFPSPLTHSSHLLAAESRRSFRTKRVDARQCSSKGDFPVTQLS